MNIGIWLIGSNGSGKSTQAKKLLEFFKTREMTYITMEVEGRQKVIISSCGIIANIGKVSEAQCSGADTLNKKDLISEAYIRSIRSHKITIVDSIMSTGKYVEFMREVDRLLVVLLDFPDEEENYKRIQLRRSKKRDVNIDTILIADKTKSNLTRKIQNFRNQFNKVKKECDGYLKIDATLGKNKIHRKILKQIDKLIK